MSLAEVVKQPDETAAQFAARRDGGAKWNAHVLRANARGSTGLLPPSRRSADAAKAAKVLASPRDPLTRDGSRPPKPGPSHFFPGYMTPTTPFAPTPVRLKTPPRPATPEEVRAAREAPPQGPLHTGVTAEDLKGFHSVFSQKVSDKFKSLRSAWRNFDSNGRGVISREQLQAGLVNLNLDMLRPEVIDNFFELADVDKNGVINYQELAQALDAADVLQMSATRARVDPAEAVRAEYEAKMEMERANLRALARKAGMTVEDYVAYFADIKL